MSLYRTRPASLASYRDWCDDEPYRHDVMVDGPKEVDTGLVDLHGNQICRVQPPIGFGRMDEWQ